jgi:methylmalonyl-CoA mutase, N-terminal domain
VGREECPSRPETIPRTPPPIQHQLRHPRRPGLRPAHPDPDYDEKLNLPGEYPFTRGVQPTMYRGRYWTMRQYAGFATAAESNERYKFLLSQGQTGLSVAFDLPTQIGYDSDDPMALGEVGKVGVSIPSLDDMAICWTASRWTR